MTDSLLLLGLVGTALLAGGAGLILLGRQRPEVGDGIQQLPSPSARRRAARDVAISHGVRMAAMLSRIDGEVHATELDAIHEFITTHVKKADIPFAARIMRAGLDGRVDVGLDEVIDTILAVADDEQKDLVVGLLVYVACADGHIHRAERSFLHEVAPRFGVSLPEIDARVDRGLAQALSADMPTDPDVLTDPGDDEGDLAAEE